MFISVIVCTRNRCDKLNLMLDSLNQAAIPEGVEFEVVVVDNGSTDATAQRVSEYAAGKQRVFRYVYEGMRGKSSALNAGLKAAHGDVFGFTDDDCIVDATWVAQIAAVFSDPSIALAGGRVELYDKRDRPSTLITETEPLELAQVPAMFFKPLIIGANTVFRRAVFEAVGDYDLLLGPGSPDSAVAEDMDYVYRAYRKGFRVVYRPQLLVFHNHGRQSEEEERRNIDAYTTGRGSFFAKHLFSDKQVITHVLRDCRNILRGFFRSFAAGMLPRFHARFLRGLVRGAFSRIRS